MGSKLITEKVKGIVPLIDVRPDWFEKISAGLGFQPKRLLAYGNLDLLDRPLFICAEGLVPPKEQRFETWKVGDRIEQQAEAGVLEGKVLLTGIVTPLEQRGAVVPLRWGAPRILVIPCAMELALGPDLDQEPFRSARLWRYKFDPSTDLVLTQYAPGSGRMVYNQRVTRLILGIMEATKVA